MFREYNEVGPRSQVSWRQSIIAGLLGKAEKIGTSTKVHPKSLIAHRKQPARSTRRCTHTKTKISPTRCKYCLGVRMHDAPTKRRALAEVASTNQRPYNRHETSYQCNKCNTALCTGKRVCRVGPKIGRKEAGRQNNTTSLPTHQTVSLLVYG